MSLKIIGGEYGGRVLRTVRGLGTRPLLGQVREALFNILADRLAGAIVWDLFAGTGASGLEALSHGAARVLFVEKNGRVIDVLRQNLDLLGAGATSRAVVLRADAWDPPVMHRSAFGVARDDDDDDDGASDAEIPPDLVFLDPPYVMVAEDPVKSMARARRLLERTAPGGCVVFHFEVGVLDEDDFDDDLDLDLREWGTTAIAMMWRKGEAPERLQRRWQKERAEASDT
ncbi:MAG: RsmD family RNA methyltransferase [Planctomycetes bacterium]|nr:RsmD family RNA methyltransferase [Planctomycetota bacterium]